MRRIPAVTLTAALGLALALGGLAITSPPVAAQSGSATAALSVVRVVDGVAGAVLRNGPWTVTVPPGAFRGATQVKVLRIPGRGPAILLELADPSLNGFAKPAVLSWHATSAADAANKTIYWWNQQTFRWEEVAGATINTQTGDVSAPLAHFSIYSVGSKAGW